MAYATFADVALKYEQPLDTAQQPRVERILDDLSDILDELVPSLAARAGSDAVLARRARRVAGGRHHPHNWTTRAGYSGSPPARSPTTSASTRAGDRTGPGKPFTDAELRPLRPAGRSTVGTIRVRAPGDATWTTTATADAVP
jgi:hypothetical protein